MTSQAKIDESLRSALMERPDLLLEDADLMRALVAANERAMGANIVDLRGIAMERLEARLDRLEETHRSVIAAAYENTAEMLSWPSLRWTWKPPISKKCVRSARLITASRRWRTPEAAR